MRRWTAEDWFEVILFAVLLGLIIAVTVANFIDPLPCPAGLDC